MVKMVGGDAFPVEFFAACFEPDLNERKFRWRARPSEHFKSERACRAWNTAKAGKIAGSLDAYGRHVVCLTYRGVTRQVGLDVIAAALGLSTSLCYGMPHSHAVTPDEMEARYDALEAIVNEIEPCSVRQVYYQAVVRGLMEKTEPAYDKVQRALVALRREGRIPYSAITDGTRWQIKPDSYSSLEEALRRTASAYRKALWADQPIYVEVWLEKDALSGVVAPITRQYDVPLMVARRFSSLSFLSRSAEDINEIDKPCFVYHLGDHDPSGRAAGEHIERTLRELAPFANIRFERLAVTTSQIETFNLPSRPTKRTDSRAKAFEAEFGRGSVELDSIHPDTLRAIVREAIERHIDKDQLAVTKVAERSEREILRMFAADARDRYGEGGAP